MNSSRSDPFPTRVHFIWFIALAGISLSVYLLAAKFIYRLGFPLDDAWIHHTYARNLAHLGEWAFLPGKPSAGSTAPLWSALLAIGYLLNLNLHLWSFNLGYLLLAAVGVAGGWVFRILQPQNNHLAFWAGMFLIFEWHLVWAAGSGMETLLFAFVIVVLFGLLENQSVNWSLVGLLVGVSIWVRPDGLTLLGPVLWSLYFKASKWKTRLKNLVVAFSGIALLVSPYLWFNFKLGGDWWPNTFFAKHAEYAVLRQAPLLERYFSQIGLLLVGAGALILPGVVLNIIRIVKNRGWAKLGWVLWLFGFIFVYAVRLPVTYQHGRYLIPVIPIFYILGISGFVSWSLVTSKTYWRSVFDRVWLVSTIIVAGLFWLLGARSYGLDVAVIESEMVATATWVSENTPNDALVAAHDIGALGYYGQRELLDLAGLVSPNVIPFIRDEVELEKFLEENGADYLVTFPGWYPMLVSRVPLVYQTFGEFSPSLGGENMSVYLWMKP